MTIEEKYNQAIALVKAHETEKAAKMLNELASETGNCNIAMAAAEVSNYVAEENIVKGSYIDAMLYCEHAIKWTAACSKTESFMKENKNRVIEQYRNAMCLKGRAFFKDDNSDVYCLEPLKEAAELGSVDALYWMGIYYVTAMQNSENEADYDKNCIGAVGYLEIYIKSLNGGECPHNNIKSIFGFIANAYEQGLGVQEDKEKAAYYKNLYEA